MGYFFTLTIYPKFFPLRGRNTLLHLTTIKLCFLPLKTKEKGTLITKVCICTHTCTGVHLCVLCVFWFLTALFVLFRPLPLVQPKLYFPGPLPFAWSSRRPTGQFHFYTPIRPSQPSTPFQTPCPKTSVPSRSTGRGNGTGDSQGTLTTFRRRRKFPDVDVQNVP